MAIPKTVLADQISPLFGIPWTPVLTDEQAAKMSTEKIAEYVKLRQYIDEQGQLNPVGAGWSLPGWQMVFDNWNKYSVHIVLGGNGSSKSVFGARLALSVCAAIPAAEVYAFHINERRGIDDQERYVYEALPESLKNIPTKKGIHHNLQFTQKNGFTDHIMILPPLPGHRRGGSIKFYNYAQFSQNDQIIEGIRAHFVWLDEHCPLPLMETLRMGRLHTFHGRILLTYTVISGWSETVEKILAKTITLKKRWCDHPKVNGYLPVMQESQSMESCAVYYFWTSDNPFTDWAEFQKINANADKATILARAYGVPTKSIQGAFPLFSKEIHVVKHESLPWLNEKMDSKGKPIKYRVTRYMAIDPAGSKNWFCVWIAVDAAGAWWVYREWPDISYGEWALGGDKAGPAQKGLGFGLRDYVELIRNAEDGENIFERFIDPRMGAAERQTEAGATTLISELDSLDLSVIPAPAASSDVNKGEIEDGVQLLNDLIGYKTEKPIDAVNRPHFYVSDRCANVIYSLTEYTAKLGAGEVTKDPIDCLRFLRKGNAEYLEDAPKVERRTGVY